MTRALLRIARSSCVSVVLAACAAAPLAGDDFPAPTNTEKAASGPLPPDEVCRTATLPPGFQLSVFAAEPDVQNPIAICTDERGRLWVAENYSWAGDRAGGWDADRRDRIVILEDTDGDGRHDRRTVFWDEAHRLTSVEVGYGGVWAICLPQLLFIPDADRDDVPDGPPRVVLDGFQLGPVGHTPANGLKWGPDGWLHGRHGIQATSAIGPPGAGDSQRVKINTGLWRFHPTRGTVEAVMHGMTNSWGSDFDRHGETFVINTVIGHLWHAVYGAHVQRMYGADLNPHVYQLIEQTADHVHWDTGESWGAVQKGMSDKTDAAGGGHAHCGLMIYQGDDWPEEYRHRLYTLNFHGLRINRERLERHGAGYVAKHEPDLCRFADPWFRGMDLVTGPDGGVLIADWSDTGECHDHDGVHRTSGRIYKLTHAPSEPMPPFDLAALDDRELARLQLHANAWWPRQARRVLAERAAARAPAEAGGELRAQLLRIFAEQTEPGRRLRLMETLHAVDAVDADWLIARLSAPDEHERVAALRFLVDHRRAEEPLPAPVAEALLHLARTDSSGLVLLHVASALQRLPWAERWPIAEALAEKQEYADDRMFPHMLWYGIEPAVPRAPDRAIGLVRRSAVPLVTANIARRLTLEIDRDLAAVERLLAVAVSGEARHGEAVVAGMAAALDGWRKAPAPANWPAAAEKYAGAAGDTARQVQKLAVVFGDGRALDELRALAMNRGDPATRRQALRALVDARPDDLVADLHRLLTDREVNAEAVRGLARYDHSDTPARILQSAAKYAPEARAAMIDTLASRPAYARPLVEAIGRGEIAAGELSAFHAGQIRGFEDAALTARLAAVWGDVRGTAAEKRSLLNRYQAELTPAWLAEGDLSAGRALFEKTCASCHVMYGSGRKLGPDLTGSNRKNLDYLLENIIDPSASVGIDFRTVVVLLADGRVLTGVVSERNERTLVLQTAQGPVALDRHEIEETTPTGLSLMPEGLLQNLSAEQTRDLFAYLMGSEQPPLPEQPE